MPMARALRNWRVPGRGARTRPSGRPIRMVTPAMKPSSRVWDSLISSGAPGTADGNDGQFAGMHATGNLRIRLA